MKKFHYKVLKNNQFNTKINNHKTHRSAKSTLVENS